MYFFGSIYDWLISVYKYIPGFIEASGIVLLLTVGTVLLSWVCGLVAALGSLLDTKVLRAPFRFYIWFIRGTPTLIQIFIVYFGLPQFGIRFSPYTAGVLALGFNSGAYVAEIIRGGISAIPQGQMESAVALGMGNILAFRRIIFPQVVRIIIPAITNEAITMLKNTSLLSAITVFELTLRVQVAIARTFRPFDFYIIAAFIYLAMTSILSKLSKKMENQYSIAYTKESKDSIGRTGRTEVEVVKK